MARYGDDIVCLAARIEEPGQLDELVERVGDARVVMLGGATHGTHEFSWWRAALTRRLITERGFSFVAVEGDWPDCARVDRAVRWHPDTPRIDPREALLEFGRWPTWMWANEEVADFGRWLARHNTELEEPDQVGFHGLDVYSLWESLREIMVYLREHDPTMVPAALEAYRCFEPFAEQPHQYAIATRFVPMSCENEIVDLLIELRRRAARDSGWFDTWQNAEVALNAERYYRAMVGGGPQAWNIRDCHMDESLARLLAHYGSDAKAIVWAHNTHVGDARATDMFLTGEVNIGQLARQRYGRDDVALVGLGTHRGTVVAGESWGAPAHVMPLPPARDGSLEDFLHAAAPERACLVFPPRDGRPDLLTAWLDHRTIGVVHDPSQERDENYVPTVLGDRYDAFLWFDLTEALWPLHTRRVDELEQETYPAGV
ncbi:erythromycin esterase family protein [Dactylosporangium sp. NPDC048998]|uniref:erythromycin esterase family protein n=1 Tax=Dactylosporangium sp. NPDC048998 TaxID=3363976 RepID=UPI0037221ED6